VSNSCPDCGSQVEFSSQPAQLLTGSCAACGHSFTLFQGTVAPGTGGAAPTPVGSPSGPPCGACGATLALTPSDHGFEAVCTGCSSTFHFVLQSDEEEAPVRRPMGRGSYRREEPSGFAPPRARPCRECGGPLQFTTSPEGLVTGTCGSCGNRFTLPPRREGGGGGGRPRSMGGGRFGPRPPGGAGWGRGRDRAAPGRFRSRGPPFRRRNDRFDDDEGASGRRRRNDDE
jgi:hypothetical protein